MWKLNSEGTLPLPHKKSWYWIRTGQTFLNLSKQVYYNNPSNDTDYILKTLIFPYIFGLSWKIFDFSESEKENLYGIEYVSVDA